MLSTIAQGLLNDAVKREGEVRGEVFGGGVGVETDRKTCDLGGPVTLSLKNGRETQNVQKGRMEPVRQVAEIVAELFNVRFARLNLAGDLIRRRWCQRQPVQLHGKKCHALREVIVQLAGDTLPFFFLPFG